jgi:hypothetical protein
MLHFTAFIFERAFPDLVRGPVLNLALARFASIRCCELIETSPVTQMPNSGIALGLHGGEAYFKKIEGSK